jgi:uncharacterized protein (TIGR03437 family)
MRQVLVHLSLAAASVWQAWPQRKIDAVVNSASFQPGLPAGGSLATAFCSNLTHTGDIKPGIYVASSPLPYELGGLSVTVNGFPAPILAVVITSSGAVWNAQINFQVPLERNISLLGPGVFPGSLAMTQAELKPLPELPAWGGFFSEANGYAIAQHASDYSPVTPENPAHPGETIIAYANDFITVWPPPPIGIPVPPQPLFQPIPWPWHFRFPGYLYLQKYPTLDYKGQSWTSTPALETPFLGLAPGMIGVEQINFVVPANQQPGDWALFFNAGSCPDGSPTPGKCGLTGHSSPYVKLPVR